MHLEDLMKRFVTFIGLLLVWVVSCPQPLSVSVSASPNGICSGTGCEYEGPTIMINEVMLKPVEGDGSIVGSAYSDQEMSGEWIELYNPHKCESVDISCYFLGNNAQDGAYFFFENYGGGFVLPQGTVVPPQGFCVVRGENAPAVPSNLLVANGGNVVEVVVNSRYCFGGHDQAAVARWRNLVNHQRIAYIRYMQCRLRGSSGDYLQRLCGGIRVRGHTSLFLSLE